MNTKMFCWMIDVWDFRRSGTYEINKVSFSCFGDKIHILNNGYDGLALCY